ncbi:MAG: hypothetical protein MZU79_02095 [Anaerotruncus sp.]|nr:hypothetical protein [Anaerotruncus sp.]
MAVVNLEKEEVEKYLPVNTLINALEVGLRMQEIIKKKLFELATNKRAVWNIPRETGNHLNLMIKMAGYKDILEIGTSNSYSAIWFAEAARANGGSVTGIDYYQERIDMALANFQYCGLQDFVEIKKGQRL